MIKEIHLPFDFEWAPAVSLKAGELQCLYETGKLRYIRRGETELIRMIYGAVRDDNWGTLPYSIEDEKLVIENESFSIQFTAVYGREKPVYKALFTIEGRAGSSISFSMKGTALAAFQKNRIGICVHHPIQSCAGQAVMVKRPDGTSYQEVFPEMVSQHQPLLMIQEMQWTTSDDTTVQLFFDGDVFETEDQRNWSDSSYKTYSTPQHIPFPVGVLPGEAMLQELRLIAVNSVDGPIQVKNYQEEKIPFPVIGYGKSVGHPPVTNAEAALLQKIPFNHYRVVLEMDLENWAHELNAAFAEAILLRTRLELVIVFPQVFNSAPPVLLSMLQGKQDLLHSILLLQKNKAVSPHALQAQVYPLLKAMLPAVPVGYGTGYHFVDLHRQRPGTDFFDFTSYSVHPRVHMTDNRSVWENLDNQPDMVATAGSFSSGKPVFVSPVTLRDGYQDPGNGEKQSAALVACWTLMSIQQLAMAGSITLHEIFGEAGLLRSETNSDGTHQVLTSVLYEMLAALHQFQPVFIIKRYKSRDVLTNGLLLENAGGERLFFKMPGEITGAKYQ